MRSRKSEAIFDQLSFGIVVLRAEKMSSERTDRANLVHNLMSVDMISNS